MYMKKLVFPIIAGSLLFTACQDAPKADSADASDAQEVEQAEGIAYTASVDNSKVEWIGTKPVGQHHGIFKLQEGSLVVAENKLEGGTFIINVKSIDVDDEEQGQDKLEGHLLSADFFDAENHPTGTFEITSVTEGVEQTEDLVMKDATHMITGNLTLKGVTKSITFPAKVVMGDNQVVADANFNIDRTQWDMTYGNDQSLGDKFIRPEVNLQVHLEATPQM